MDKKIRKYTRKIVQGYFKKKQNLTLFLKSGAPLGSPPYGQGRRRVLDLDLGLQENGRLRTCCRRRFRDIWIPAFRIKMLKMDVFFKGVPWCLSWLTLSYGCSTCFLPSPLRDTSTPVGFIFFHHTSAFSNQYVYTKLQQLSYFRKCFAWRTQRKSLLAQQLNY